MARHGRSFPIKPHMNNTFRLFQANSWVKTLTETITNTDTLIRNITRTITETVTNTDTIVALKVLLKTLTETVTSTDTFIRSITRNMLETVTNTDTISKTISRFVSEVITNTDTFTYQTLARILSIILTEKLTVLEDFRIFLNNKVARWRDKNATKSNAWSERNTAKTNDWVDKGKIS